MKKKTKRLLIFAVCFFLLLGAACYTVFIKPTLSEDKWVYLETPVEQGDLKVGVTESGTLTYEETTQKYDLDLSTEDDDDEDDDDDDDDEETLKYLRVEKLYVAKGQRISEGDQVLKFTEKSIQAVRRKLTGALTEAEVELEEARQSYNLSAISFKETYDLNILQSGNAETTYQKTVQKAEATIANNQSEIARLQKAIELAQAKVEDKLEDYEDAKEDYDKEVAALEAVGTHNQLVTIKFENSYLSAKTAYENAKKSYENLLDDIETNQDKIIDLQKDIEDAQAKLGIDKTDAKQVSDLAHKNGSVAKEKYTASLNSLQSDVDEAEEKRKTLADKLEDFEAFVGDGTVYAVGSGIVTTLGYEEDDDLKTAGTMVAFASEESMSISVDVSQEDIIQLGVGDHVEIVFSAYDDQTYEGVISSISTTNTSSNSVTVSYPVTIHVNGDTSALYSGMTADVTFVTQEKANTIYVAKKAIVKENGRSYVYMKSGNDYQLHEVETGLSNGTNIEILSGLSAGDTVYIASKVSASAEDEEDTTGGKTGQVAPGGN